MKKFKLLAGPLVAVLALSLAIVPATITAADDDDDELIDFTDVSNKYRYIKAINYLQSEKIVEGYPDGSFKPDSNINRAEFLKIVMEASDFAAQGINCYQDVNDEWFAKYVCGATVAGLVEGYPDGFFRPEQEINFVEASKIVANTLKLQAQNGTAGGQWYDPFVYALEEQEAIPFDIATFDSRLTRGQMSEMIWRIKENRTYKPAKTYDDVATSATLGNELHNFNSCQELRDFFFDNTSEPFFYDDFEVLEDVPAGAIPVARTFAELGGGAEGVADFSETNIQVQGVDEADIVKNDGQYIYSIKDFGSTVKIVKAFPPDEMTELSTIDLSEKNIYTDSLYLHDDQLIILGDAYYDNYVDFAEKDVNPDFFYQGGSMKVLIYDISDRSNPKLQREISIEGDHKSSRKIGDTIYLVGKQDNYVWPWLDPDDWAEDDLVPLFADGDKLEKLVNCEDILYMPQAIDESNFLIVAAIPLNPQNAVVSQVVMGSSSDVFASLENLYVAQEKYDWWGWYDDLGEEEETYIHKFKLSPNRVHYTGMGVVPGSVLNQFSMDEFDGNFRIATTVGDVWNDETPSVNNLYILDENLNVVGKIEGLASGERIYSARFVGERAYVVTFKEIDPLFVFDVSDPTNPSVLGELKIPGFSDYLHPYDEDHIIGFGLDTATPTPEEIEAWNQNFAWFQGVKLAMFDVTDVSNPVELHREIIGDRGTSSLLNYTHKALLYSTEKGRNGGALMAFPITVSEIPEDLKNDPDAPASTYGEAVFNGAYIYDVHPDRGFELRGTITQYDDPNLEESGFVWFGPWDVERIIYIGDYLYTISQSSVMANDIETPQDQVSRLEYSE